MLHDFLNAAIGLSVVVGIPMAAVVWLARAPHTERGDRYNG